MVTITMMGQLQTTDGERDLAIEVPAPLSVRQLIRRQGPRLEPVAHLMQQKKLLITVNKRIASDDTLVRDGDTIKLVAHDGMGGSGLGPAS